MKNEKYTPPEYVEAVKAVLGQITFDPFSCKYANDNFVKANLYGTKEDSALTRNWAVKTVYMNPPYSGGEYAPAVEKFLEERNEWGFVAITLTNNNTDTVTTQKLMSVASAYCFPSKRINYYSTEGQVIGNRYGQLFCYFGDDVKKFNEVFSKFGVVSINPGYIVDKLTFL